MDPGVPNQPHAATVSVQDIDGVTVLSVSGAVDALTAPTVRSHLDAALAGGVRALVIDLSDVDFLGSVELTGVDEFVPLHPTLEAALDALRA